MLFFLRILAALLVLAVVAFGIFGFIATFEPLNPETKTIWRMIYETIGVTAILLAIWLLLSSRRRKKPVSLRKLVIELNGLGSRMLIGFVGEVLITVVLIIPVLIAFYCLGCDP